MGAMTLVLLLAAAASAVAPAPRQDAPQAGARATGHVAVTILEGARIAAGEAQQGDVPALQDSNVRGPDGSASPARLVEFQ